MRTELNRRRFLKATCVGAGSALAFPYVVRSAEAKKLRIAVIGVGGRGGHALGMSKGEEVVALCDADTAKMGGARKAWPKAGVYQDYREMFESRDDYDVVIVSTPDHHHYPASIRALRAGKAVYCEKPLSWSMRESLHLAAEAEKHKLPTQLGGQTMAGSGWRVAHDYVKGGAIGQVTEVHTWTSGHERWFTDGVRTPEGEDPVPQTLDWDVWLGPAPVRPYKKGHYHPARWRGWIDFGNGAVGDWCCHLLNAFYKTLEPGLPVSVECLDSTGPAVDSYPKGKTVKWQFAADGDRPAFDAYWHDGVHEPPRMPGLEDGRKMGASGSYFVGTEGTCWVVGSHNNSAILVPETRRKEFGRPEKKAPPSRGHEKEFFMAVRGEIPYNAPLMHFGYGAQLTAFALMANIACRVDGELLYDAAAQRFTNSETANRLMTREARDGWYLA